jgi:hypothetical protein
LPAFKQEPFKAEVVQTINKRIEEGWKANKLTPSEVCSDHEFIRRASLDIIGRIAKVDEIDHFLKDPKETRRALLIDRLLKKDEYATNFANLWSNWLLTRSGPFGRGEYHRQMHTWLGEQFSLNRKYDDIVRALLTAKGKNGDDNGAVNFILAHLGEPVPQNNRGEEGNFDMVPITSRITRLFLGIQTQCCQCHDHPFDARLKQQHYWGVNVFLRQVKREGQPAMRRRDPQFPPLTLSDDTGVNRKSTVPFEKRNMVILNANPTFFDVRISRDEFKSEGFNRREKLAELILGHENFPKAIVNRMWGHFFGRGFTSPVDDFNEQNAVSHPELLNELADKFKNYGYNQQDLIRWICNSQPYQLKSSANATNDKPDAEPFFSRMLLKPMSPEQLIESLEVAIYPPPKALTPEAAKKVQEAKAKRHDAWMGRLITNFGDDEGNEVTFNGTIIQALLMMNGQDINGAITDKEGTVAMMMERRAAPATNITYLYLATLNRPPLQNKDINEIRAVLSCFPLYKTADKDPAAPYHDLLWALLNSNEFLLNH